MAYTKQTWANDEAGGTPISADRLNHMEDGIDDADTRITDHLADTADAHDASAISFTPTGTVAATDVQAAIAEVASEAGAADHGALTGLADDDHTQYALADGSRGTFEASGAVATHAADTTSVHGIADTAALETTAGAQSKVDTHVNDTTAAHAASAIAVTPAGNLAADDVQEALTELQTDVDTRATSTALTDHINDAADAHDASAISILDTANDFTATDVEGALAELQTDHEADSTALTDHVADTSGAHAASAISIVDAGADFTATDVEGALAELQSDHEADSTALSDHIADAAGAHAATAISFTPAGTIAATTVQAAIEEVASEAGGGSSVGDLLDHQMVRKAADESVTSSTTLQDDNELLFAMGTSQTWLVEFGVLVEGGTAEDIKLAIAGPASVSGGWTAVGAYHTGGSLDTATWTNLGTSRSYEILSGTTRLVLIKAVLTTGATSGDGKLQFAQATSGPNASRVKANSWLIARRLA